MEIIIQKNRESASLLAADIVATLIRRDPEVVLGLATGSTPLMLYRELVRRHREEGLDFSRVTTFNLDEYRGLEPDHPCSYHHFMWENLFGEVNVQRSRVHLPDGMTKDVPATCRAYEEAIVAAGGIELQVLGIGANGHIGFNEPSSSLASRTRIKTLSRETITDNARFFGGEQYVPRHVLTMGVGTIMDCRRCLLLAFGEGKAEAVAKMVEGPISAMVPASVLQLHRRAYVVLDEASASRLELRDYYRWVYEHKPAWQAGAGSVGKP